MHTCETCGKEWPENYCPECGHTIGKATKLAMPPPLPEPPGVPSQRARAPIGAQLFGLFKKRQPATLPPLSSPPPTSASHPPEIFWDEMGMGRLVPIYLQLHLAARNPQHTLVRRPDGTIDTDDVPGLIIFWDENPRRQQQIQTDFTRLMSEQLPNNPSLLSALPAEEIVSRLCNIYTKVTGKDMYGVVCKKWCIDRKLSC